MKDSIQNPEELDYEVISEMAAVARIENDICDIFVYRYDQGYEAPRHSHSDTNIKFILKGKILVDGEKEVSAGAKYECGDIYYFTVPEITYMLVVQKSGTKRVLA